MPLGLDVEYQLLRRECIRIEMLFQDMERARNELLLVQHRELRLEISQHSCQRRHGPLGASSLDQFPKFSIHLKSRKKPLTRTGQSFPDRRDRIELMVGPMEPDRKSTRLNSSHTDISRMP